MTRTSTLRSVLLSIVVVAAIGCGVEDGGSTDDTGSDSTTDTTGGDDGSTGTDDTTGAGDGDSTTGDGDDTTGEPDPPMGTLRILPLGDSLTLGFGTAGAGAGSEIGYRKRLGERLAADGIDFDFVGSQSNGSSELSDKDHEGYNGYAVPQVAEVAAVAVPEFEPDVVLLMAGTNDQIVFVPPTQPPADAANDMESLLEQIHTDAPNAQIILAQIIPLTFNDEGVKEYNALLPAIVERQRAAGVAVRLVDMYKIGRENLSADGIHPTQAGYDLLADIWYPALLEAISELNAQ